MSRRLPHISWTDVLTFLLFVALATALHINVGTGMMLGMLIGLAIGSAKEKEDDKQ